MIEITPGPSAWGDGTRPYKRGDRGWQIASCQANLNLFGNQLALDGAFGPATEKVAKAFQAHRGLTADGIVGPVSQERICRDLAGPEAKRVGLVHDLIRGVIENESSFYLAAYTPHPDGTGFDLGALQEAFYGAGSQAAYAAALNVRAQARSVSQKLRDQHDRYVKDGASEKLAWRCAALYHNRPVSADRLAAGLPASTTTGPVAWVEKASGGRLHTIQEWCEDYIARATRYVAWPS